MPRVAQALARRIRMIVSRAVVTLVNDSLKVQGLQLTVLDNEVAQVQRFQEYGFTSVPKAGAEAIVAAVSGVRSHLVALAVDDGRYRKNGMQAGEVALYTDEGDYIQLSRGRVIRVVAGVELDVTAPQVTVTASTQVKLDTPNTLMTGELTVDGVITGKGGMAISGGSGASVDGSITATGDVTGAGVSLDQHTHPDPQGGNTGAPN